MNEEHHINLVLIGLELEQRQLSLHRKRLKLQRRLALSRGKENTVNPTPGTATSSVEILRKRQETVLKDPCPSTNQYPVSQPRYNVPPASFKRFRRGRDHALPADLMIHMRGSQTKRHRALVEHRALAGLPPPLPLRRPSVHPSNRHVKARGFFDALARCRKLKCAQTGRKP